jgi:hypothetical protein
VLKLKGIADSLNIQNVSDFYVKISIWFGDFNESCFPSIYWDNYAKKNKTHIQIGLTKDSGFIGDLTILAMPEIKRNFSPNIREDIVKINGQPSFDTALWNDNNYLRVPGDFDVFVKDESVYISFLQNEVILKVINNDIVFGFDKNNVLCFIQMAGMKLNEEGFLEKIG